MRRVLVLLTQSLDPLNDVVTHVQTTLPDQEVRVMDLTEPSPDYAQVLTAVFESDSVQVW
jgi:hypothetical protein